MKINSLIIDNFKGIKHLELHPNGKNIAMWADNGLGKTSVFDAFQWLLFNKDSLGKADFEIKPRGSNGSQTEVEAKFDFGGSEVAFKKVYYEKYTKKRGSAQAEFTGNTTDFFLDGVPAKQKEYLERIKEIASEQTFRLLTDPRYFNEQLHWTERRNILIDMCGDVSNEDVIESDQRFSELPSIIGKHSIEDYKKIAASRRTAINKELETIPARIDENNKSIVNPENSLSTARTLVKSHEKKRADKERELNRILNNTEAAEQAKKLTVIESKIISLENEHQLKVNKQSNALRGVMDEAQSALNKAVRNKKDTLSRIAIIEKSIAMDKSGLQPLRDQWQKIFDEKFDPVAEPGSCPSCGQSIPQSQIDDANEKALEVFNKDKAQRLESNNKKGIAIKKGIEPQEKELAELNEKVEFIDSQIHDLEAAKHAYENQTEIDPPKELNDLRAEKETIRAAIRQLEEDSAPKVEFLNAEIKQIKDRIAELEGDVNQHVHNAKTDQRIEELKQTEKDLSAEYEELERHIYLIEEFTRAKCHLLDEKINSRFQTCKFKLFDEQINGGLSDNCELTIDGVPYWSINNAARIQAGAEIISVAQEYYGIKAPVVFDNRESVTVLPKMNCQIISLYVSEADKELRFEYLN